MEYMGHKNRTHWNVSLWLSNDEGLYRLMQDAIKRHHGNKVRAARAIKDQLPTRTPDGYRYSVAAIIAAMD